jgi:hypothetical protein
MARTDETYNGWVNRETWAVSLHLNNTQWMQEAAIENARADEYGRTLQEWVESLVEDVFDGAMGQDVNMMARDIGSLWRVDWKAVRDGLLED